MTSLSKGQESHLKVVQVYEVISTPTDQVWGRCCQAFHRTLHVSRVSAAVLGRCQDLLLLLELLTLDAMLSGRNLVSMVAWSGTL